MNIKQAKEEIKHTIQAYHTKDSFGNYKIPRVQQRPVLLIGPPGIGKTAIMEQITKECQIGLVSYTITHHTRQSAIGLPFIQQKVYGEKEYSITEYTMSEIIASVYDCIERTGQKEGVLFIDEINCVSETLAPTMLQFLQGKTFGTHEVPEGWVIVAAGNPPEYNKSVREFDVVTLDRVKYMEISEDFVVWKQYAYEKNLHEAILSYLETKKEDFYRVETTIDGKEFVTARGWEDLSQIMKLYEELEIPVTESLVIQYLQHKRIARDFTNYFSLYEKYKKQYQVDDILEGNIKESQVRSLANADFDEKISMVSLLLLKIAEKCKEALEADWSTKELYGQLKQIQETKDTKVVLERYVEKRHMMSERELLGKEQEQRMLIIEEYLRSYIPCMEEEGFDGVKQAFQTKVDDRKEKLQMVGEQLNSVFVFLETAFKEGQELIWFVSELTTNPYTSDYISRFGCDKYYSYSKELLLTEKEQEIKEEIEEISGLLKYMD